MPPPPPTVTAAVPCEMAYVDSCSKRVSLLGVFGGFTAPAFPVELPRHCLYVALTDGRGTVPLAVRLVGPDDAQIVARELPPATFADPLHVKEIVAELPAVTLPGPGLYRWQVLCAGAVLHERVLPAGRR